MAKSQFTQSGSATEASIVDDLSADELRELIATTVEQQRQQHGRHYYTLGKLEEMQLNYDEAYDAFKEAVRCQKDNAEYLNCAGLSGDRVADYEQAEQYHRKCLDVTVKELGEDHPDTATCYDNLASNLDKQGQSEAAQSLYGKAQDIRQRTLDKDYLNTVTGANNPADISSEPSVE